eukprot:COSAG06_NODE_1912_length_8077_cov_102.258586_7_plen_54_part_00
MHGRVILVRKRVFLRHLILKLIILPRQARDGLGKHSKKDAFLQGASSGGHAVR